MAQLALFRSNTGRNELFDPQMLDHYLKDLARSHVDEIDARSSALTTWVENLRALGRVSSKAQEAQLEASFAQLLTKTLDYLLYPDATATLWAKPGKHFTGLNGIPDLVMGDFSNRASPEFVAVLELKTPGTDLDKPQVGRADRFSPVEQAFDYASRLLRVRWVLVSDMRIMRLYSVDDQHAYMQFDLSRMGDPDEFRRMYWLLSKAALVDSADDGPVASLLTKSTESRVELSEGFYEAYTRIRLDLYQEIEAAASAAGMALTRTDLLESTQRLLDRMLFIFYCEDHPAQLIDRNTVEKLTTLAGTLPGTSPSKVYGLLKQLFREVDAGSPPASGLNISGYNGELFKLHPVLDSIDLPDSLHKKRYVVNIGVGKTRAIQGVWGLYVFDFWRELDEHMLGKIFEESLSDLVDLGTGQPVNVAEKMDQRKRGGIFYTSDLLADFATKPALGAVLDLRASELAASAGRDPNDPDIRLEALGSLRVADIACGSGAFVVSSYRNLLTEFWRLQEAKAALTRQVTDLFTHADQLTQASLLRDCLYGLDLLPQAVEIAKLALWLRSARREEKVPDLSGNFVAADSTDLVRALSELNLSPGDLDLVVGNPPWGSEVDSINYAHACTFLGIDPDEHLDSWELFLRLGIKALRVGGRLSYVLPDSLLYEDKAPLREWILCNTRLIRLHSLGPGWFGPTVRMNTVVLELERTEPGMTNDIQSMVLAGRWRKDAQSGRLPLTQVEAQRSRQIPQERSLNTPDFRIEVFRSRRDDVLIQTIEANSVRLVDLCDRYRGEEINKAGEFWACPSCNTPTVPGKKEKGGGFHEKLCSNCGARITSSTATVMNLVESEKQQEVGWEPFVDGDDVSRRFQPVVATKGMKMGLPGWSYKASEIYTGPKILVRQAGVGLVASVDYSDARCPQSVYIYRLKPELLAVGWTHEYLLGAILSRTMTFVQFKRFGEIDPDKAHAKMTHQRLADLPIPDPKLSTGSGRRLVAQATGMVSRLLQGTSNLGSRDDWDLELLLRTQWGLSGDDGTYINGEFFDLPAGQAIRDLFPDGAPDPRAA